MTKASDNLMNYARNYQQGGQGLEALLPLIDQVKELEQLCNDLFDHVCAEQIGARVNMQQFAELSERMDDLGLMEEFHD